MLFCVFNVVAHGMLRREKEVSQKCTKKPLKGERGKQEPGEVGSSGWEEAGRICVAGNSANATRSQ